MKSKYEDNALASWIGLWNAIHDASQSEHRCDIQMSSLMQEVISGLSLYQLSYSFNDQATAARARSMAVAKLDRLIPALPTAIAN